MDTPKPTARRRITSFITQGLPMFVIVTFFIISCDQDDDAANCLFTRSNITFADGGTEEFNHTFNSNNKLIKWVSVHTANNGTSTYSYEYTYDLNGNIVMATYPEGRVVYTYNADNQVTKEEYFDGNSLVGLIENEYNGSGQVIKRQHYNVSDDGVATKDYYSIIEYTTTTTKNILRKKRYSPDGVLSLTTEYLYDNKKNPWTSTGVGALYGYVDNNITKQTRTEGASTRSDYYSYKYTEQGYPSEMIYTNDAGATVYTAVYTYTCK